MTVLPTNAYVTDPARTSAEKKQAERDTLDVIRELPGGEAETTLTIAGGAITAARAIHSVDTEGAAAADDLANIVTANAPDGRLLMIRCANAARVVTVKHSAGGAGQIALSDAADLALNDRKRWLLLKRTGADWEEVLRGYGGDKAAFKTFLGLATAALLDAAQTFTKGQRGQPKEFTDGATITLDFAEANYFYGVIGGNRTLGVPSNIVAGQSGRVNIRQDQTGGRSLAFAWVWSAANGQVQSLSTAGCTLDKLFYDVDVYATSAVTITIASPGVVTWNGHVLKTGQKIQLTTTGALPTGLSASTTYYVIRIDANSFSLATSLANAAAGTAINTSGSQSGVHTCVAAEISYNIGKAWA